MNPPKRSFRLSQKRRDLLDSLLAPAAERIPRQGERGSFPLSFAQQRLWFLDQLEPGNTVYNLPFAVMLEGELDVPALRASLAEVVRRHESLRTRFLGFEGSPLQVVEPSLAPEALPLPVLDLTALPEAARRDEAGRLVRAEVAQPFDLAAGPVFRFRLARLAADRHLAVFSLHHIAADGWSIGVLIQELAALYPAFLEGRPSPLPELEIQYADFAVWQRAWLTGERLESQLAFWKERLAGAPERLRLATDRPRPEAPDYRGGTRSLALSPDLSQALRGLAQSEEGTPFMVLLAAYALLLSRHSGQEEVVVGSPIANRNRAQLEPLIGFFVNTLALRVDLSADPPFRTLLREVRDLTLGAYAHQDLPLERLVDELGVRRELDHTPLFQVLLTLQNAPVQALRLPGLSLAPVPAEGGATRFDLTLSMGEGPGGALGGTLYYRADLFDAPTVDRLLAHFQVLLAGIAAGPDRRLSDLPLLAEPERLQLLAEWNDTRAGDPRQLGLHQLGLHQLIGARAAEAPDAVAVEMGAERLTYGGLDRRANRLARHLAGLGVGPESRVGVLLERSPDLVAVLLAVLKAGAAYLPLDPTHPAERLAWLLADAEVSLTVTREGLDRDATAIAGRSDAPFDAGVGPDSLAYVLYTSGSTGRPKGVMVPHRGVVSYLTWAAGAYEMTRGAAAPVHSPLGFDLTVTSLFAPLITGGRVVLVPEGPGIEALGEALLRREDGFALVKLTPAHLALLRDFPGQWTGRVRRFVVGGEALLWESFAFLGDAGDTVRVVNEYGPTEATVGCCVEEVAPRGDAAGPVPIGRPIANARLHLLDARLRPVPAGVPGELYIGGDGLARGYLGQPGLTAASFVPDPFADLAGEPGARLYRSGDLARRLPDGRLEFLRRIDDQLKVRGFRIEPGEVEAALLRHPGVAEAAVVARQGEGGERRLVACIVPEGATSQDLPGELRAFLKVRLPEPLIPAGFLLLEALPLTGNGKVDRRALEQLDEAPRATKSGSAAPRNLAEEVLARIWAEVLGLASVGIHDNFFELGGDSILSLQVAARARKEGLKILSRHMFQHQTVAELAAVAVPLAPAAVPAAAPAPTGPVPVPLTPIQRWFFEREQPEVHHYNQAMMLVARERWDRGQVERALTAVIRRHDTLRLRFHRGESGWFQELLPEAAGAPPFARLDLSALPPPRVSAAIQAAAAALQASLDLECGPLLRVARFEPARKADQDEPDRLLIAVHHLAIDAVSWRVLLEDLQAASRQPEAPLPAPPTSFREWAERLERHSGSEEMARELDFWLDRPAASPLPREGTAADGGTVGSAAGVSVRLEPEETAALLQEVPRVYRTRINAALLAALARAFAAWTGEPRLLVDLEGHGREEVFDGVDLSRTMGWFTSLFPVALEVPPAGGPGATLKAVQETLRAVPGRGLGYGLLRYGRPDTAERLAALPEPEVLFNYLGQMDSELPGGSPFSAAPEGSGPAISPRRRRRHLFEINGAVAGGRLQVAWNFNPAAHRRETVEALADGFAAELRSLVASCREQVARLEAAGRLEDFYPLSPMQQGLLFHALADPDSAAYFEQQTCALTGDLDEAAFRSAWERVVERHAVLRTGFAWEGLDEPLQAVRERVELPWQSLDWRGLDPAGQRERLEAFLAADREQGFDLTAPPLTRLALMRLEERRWQLVWSHHHLLLDGWSVPRLLHEVAAFYGAFRRGEDLDLPRPRPYRDYIAWLARQDEAAEEAFWRETLRGFGEPMPLDLGETALTSAPGAGGGALSREAGEGRGGGADAREGAPATLAFDLPEESTAALAALGRRLQVTPNTLVLGAWALLLARYAGRDDVVFGTTTSGRPPQLDGVEGMVGLMINTSPVRVRVAPAAPLGAWLGALQAELAEQRQHEHAPLARVQRWSEVPPGRPLFESLFVFENYPAGEALAQEGPGLAMSGFRGFSRTNYPLTLSAATGERLGFRIAWDPARFAAESVSRLAGHLLVLLEGMASQSPERALADLPLLTAAERSQLLEEWGPGPAAPAALPPVHESFAAWAARTPDALAVACGGERLTYGELDRRAERLARRLRSLGVGPEVPVAVFLERSADLVVGALAVLKAGGVYVPFDPLHPRERLAGYRNDLGEPVLVTRHDLAAVLPESRGRQVFHDEMAPDDGPPAETSPDPGRCAYVIFTSGSTGRPKGVQVEHRSLANVVRWAVETYGIGPGDRMSQVASPGFDASVLETWAALTSGAALLIPDEPTRSSPAALVRWLAAEGVTHALMPTSLAESALEEPWPVGTILRAVLTGGDRLVRRAAPGFPLFNHYGPTEITILTTAGPVEPAPAAGLPDIGRPIHGARVYLLDRHGDLVPAGIPGELCVGGVGVARGYLGRPDLTAERFVPDPFGADPGGRLYRTGDLARWLPDGRLDFLGRLDRQVKLRGVRIELGEIEARLAAHPEVREAAVVLRQDGGERRLVAWVVPRGPQPLDAAGLREHLRRGLPEAMVPAVIVAMDALPLTPGGKVDRAALPAPDAADAGGTAGITVREAYAAPRTAAEETLARIWAEVLGVERVGARDDFFALGGDSILSLQIVARAGRAGLRLSPRQIFEHPSVAELAAVASAAPATAAEQGPVTGPVPLTPIQRWFFELGFPSPHHFNQAALFEVRRRLDPGRLEAALGAVIVHHDALRLRYVEEDGAWRQHGDAPGGPVPSSAIDLTALPAARRRPALEEAAADLQASFDLGRGPLLRAGLFDLGEREPQRLLLTVHHLVVDGVSWRILLEDLQAAYAQAEQGEAPRLPAKTTSFRAWAERLATYAAAPEIVAAAPWWADPVRATAAVPAEALSDGADGQEGILSVALEAEETRALLQEVPRAYRTRIDDVLLTALARAFRKETGAARLLVDLEGHGREELFEGVDVSRTVGWFTTMYPVLLETGGDLPADLKAVKERLRAVPGRGIGYGLLRFLGDPETARRLREQPAAPVSFNYLGQFDATLAGDAEDGGLFRPAQESAGPLTAPDDPEGPGAHPLQVSGMVVGGQLRLDWAFTGTTCSRAAAGRLAAAFLAALRELIAHCRDPRVSGHTPSDFPLAGLGQDALDRLVQETGWIEDLYPLSPLQQGMLLHSLMAPESRVGFEQIACRLQGGLDPAAFRRAWQRVLDRHPALRTGIFWRGLDEPLQAVFPSLALDFREEDWRGRPDLDRRLEDALAVERRRGFDLSRPPLLRLGLFRVAEDAWLFAMSSHHILQDGWSLSLIFRDLFAGYEAYRRGLEPAAGEAPRYRDYIAWLRRQDLAEAEAFWRGELAGFAALTPLAPAVPAGEAGTGGEEAWLDPPLVESLQALARRCQVTLNTLVQAAWGLILARITGRDDVVFGTTVSGRPADLPGVEATVGLFINNLPVRVTVPAAIPFAGWLRGLRDRQAEAARFEHTPLALVQSWSGVMSAGAGRPLFDNLLVFENYPVDTALQQGEGSLQIRDVRSGVRANYPFTLVVEPGPAVLLQASYDRRFFDAPAAARLLERLREVLAGFVEVWAADPSRPVGLAFDLPALREIEPAAVPVAAAAPAPGERPDYLEPRTPLELEVAQAFEATLGHRPIGVRDDFFAFGGHSLLALHLVAEIRRRLGRELPLGALVEGATPEQLARRLAGGPEPYRPVLPLQPAGSRPPLFCVHPGGGNVLGYLGLARHLGEDQPVYAVQSREGLASDDDPPPSLDEMAARYVDAVREVQPAGPYHLAGWSFGGLAAFEMARQLLEAGEEVALLASFDQGPRLPPAPEGYDETDMLVDLWAGECPVTAGELRREGNIDAQILFLIEQAQSRGHLQRIGLAEGRTMLRIWRRHLQAGESYRPLPYRGRVTLFRCESQPEGAGPALGWDEVALGGVEVVPVPGEHSRLMEEPYVGELAAHLRAVLKA